MNLCFLYSLIEQTLHQLWLPCVVWDSALNQKKLASFHRCFESVLIATNRLLLWELFLVLTVSWEYLSFAMHCKLLILFTVLTVLSKKISWYIITHEPPLISDSPWTQWFTHLKHFNIFSVLPAWRLEALQGQESPHVLHCCPDRYRLGPPLLLLPNLLRSRGQSAGKTETLAVRPLSG